MPKMPLVSTSSGPITASATKDSLEMEKNAQVSHTFSPNFLIQRLITRTILWSDVDECEMQNLCDERATCANDEGSYTCSCDAGFVKEINFGSCEGLHTFLASSFVVFVQKYFLDVNECATDNDCDAASTTCVNTDGSYKCVCNEGFVLQTDSDLCVDRDECAQTGDNKCDSSQQCINNDGSYVCQCASGFTTEVDGSCKGRQIMIQYVKRHASLAFVIGPVKMGIHAQL